MKPGLFKSYFGAIAVPQLDSGNGEVAKVTHDWANAAAGLGGGLAVTVLRLTTKNRSVGQAKQALAEMAIANGCQWIFFLDDDVIPPGDALMKMIQMWRQDSKYKIINGVYWSKSEPPQPLIFKGSFEGAYFNWHVGDLIEADGAGAGCTFIDTSVFKDLPRPWFSTEYIYDDPRQGLDDQLWRIEDEILTLQRNFNKLNKKELERLEQLRKDSTELFEKMEELKNNNVVPPEFMVNQVGAASATEDLYFYKKAKEYLGLSCWVDTSIQCLHQDKRTGATFGMRDDFPQARRETLIPSGKGEKTLLDIGCGEIEPHFGPEYKITRLDNDPEVKPDILADARALPFNANQFDVVFASHVLEHFSFKWSINVLKEWTRVLKVGGELRLVVPNLEWAAENILKAKEGKASPHEIERSLFMYYSAQKDGGKEDFHKNGFTPASMLQLLKGLGTLDNIRVETSLGNMGNWDKDNNQKGNYNILVWATKVKNNTPVSIHKNTSIRQQEEAKFVNHETGKTVYQENLEKNQLKPKKKKLVALKVVTKG